jgi:hypothetical protein
VNDLGGWEGLFHRKGDNSSAVVVGYEVRGGGGKFLDCPSGNCASGQPDVIMVVI